MGIIDFIREAGKKLGIGDDEAEAKRESADERFDELRRGNLLARQVRELELPVDDLKVTFDDGTATVSGTVPDQETREKVVLVLGNTKGVARVDDRLSVEEPAPETSFYTVKKGDTLSAIAREQYGDAALYPRIFEANRPMLTDPDLIYPGQVLRIPPAD